MSDLRRLPMLGGRGEPDPSSDHLGDRVAAVADGALPPAQLEQVLAHVAGCTPCRAAVDAERAAKHWVSALDAPAPDLQLLGRLLTLTPTSPLPVTDQRSSLRSLVALSGASATAAVVLLVGVTATSSSSAAATRGGLPGPLPSASVATVVHPLVGRDRPAATGLPAVFDAAAGPAPTPPLVSLPVATVPGISR
jgi:hypothetical protein